MLLPPQGAEVVFRRVTLRSMTAVIGLRPDDEQGRAILDGLEKRTEMRPMHDELQDGTRRYYVEAQEADVDVFDSMLEEIDRDWRDHITNWRED